MSWRKVGCWFVKGEYREPTASDVLETVEYNLPWFPKLTATEQDWARLYLRGVVQETIAREWQ